MPMPAKEIKQLIEDAIPGAIVEIKDLGGDDNHFAAYVTSEVFRDKSPVQQHQLVYQALGNKMGGEFHALAVYTKLPTE